MQKENVEEGVGIRVQRKYMKNEENLGRILEKRCDAGRRNIELC